MEEAEKRRERLRAMRMEAAADVETLKTHTNSNLTNPLAHNPHPPPPPPLPRFDFYTDPLSSFSSHRPTSSRLPGSRHSEMSHSGIQQFHNSYAPNQNLHQAGAPYYNPNPTSTRPMGIGGSFPVHQGSPSFNSASYRGPQFQSSPNPGLGRGGNPYPMHQGSPNLVQHTQGSGPWPNSSPNPGLRYGGGPSPGSGSGRGRGRWDGAASPGGRGRGQASEAQARSYYDKSMVEDPWKLLTPVIWQSDDDDKSVFSSWGSVKMTSKPNYNRGSVRMTSCAKKARVFDKSRAEPSLAEFLAAAADMEDGDDAGTG
ncbi:hypothetical protein RND81_01G227100 [Saponaria officinalis]|uniref:Uncharacterized protein n=1 Tax=Saponaria officinalis TaxID=3572 RepID=A0AAW1N946_SAPOF